MTFTEIFNKFKNHSYIRRESWSENVFINLSDTSMKIRLVMLATSDTPHMNAINKLNDDMRLSAEDLLATDWITEDKYYDKIRY